MPIRSTVAPGRALPVSWPLAAPGNQHARARVPVSKVPARPVHAGAVDARALTQEQAASLDEPAYRRKHGMTPSLGELGCYLSHVAVFRALLASPHRAALVLEDDVLLTPALVPVLRVQGLLGGVFERDALDIDVHALHQGWLRQARRQGAQLWVEAQVTMGDGSIAVVPPSIPHAFQPSARRRTLGIQVYAPPGPEQRFKKLAAK